MKKLKLDLDALVVDSFHPSPVEDGEGTVHGEQLGNTGWHSCGARTCLTCRLSCGATCAHLTCGHVTCGVTCQGTCFAASCHHVTCAPAHTCYVTCHPHCQNTWLMSCQTCEHTCLLQICRLSDVVRCP